MVGEQPWTRVVDDRPAESRFRVRRDIFSDPELFALEMKHIFEGGWVYLGHAEQLPNPHDYLTTWIGRRPVVLMRDGAGTIRAFLNACPHKGALVCRHDKGNSRLHVCPYHSWSFDSAGTLRGLKAKAQGGYTEEFLNASHDMVPIARFDEYRGFLFGSLAADVPTLAEHLGGAATLIDLVIDQSPQGLEFVPGFSSFTYDGNWKHQLENCSDGYHVTSVHPTYLKLAQQRAEADAKSDVGGVWDRTSTFLEDTVGTANFGTFRFENGHVCSWSASPQTPGHPLFAEREELAARVGEVRAKWMFYSRNLTIFPNLQIADNFSTQVRVLRPLAPSKTEMVTYCVGPKGEAAAARRQRLRQYEDFFMPSGLATADDLVIYEDCQQTNIGASDTWQSYDRGMAVQTAGPNEEARALDIDILAGVRGPGQLWDETLMHAYYRTWLDRIAAGAARDAAEAAR